jgi:translocation and assembly module TamA
MRRATFGTAAWAAILVIAAGGCAHRDKPAKVVRKLDIEGNHAVSDRTIKKKILTAKTGWWPFAREQPFDSVAWDTDLERVERLYESKGYYQVEVQGDVATKPDQRDVALAINVREGQPTKVASLTIRGLEPLPKNDREHALAGLPLEPGTVFEEPRWEALKAQIQGRLRDEGYMTVEVRGEARVDVATHEASLTVDVTPGARYRFGEITVNDPHGVVNVDWIRDEIRVAIPKGKLFSDQRLAEAERRVFDMGAFATVRVRPGEPDREAGIVPVLADVTEAPFRTLRFGFGVGVDQIRDEVRTFAEWTHRNWLGGLRRLRLRAEVGYAFLPSLYAVLRDVSADVPRSGPIYLVQAELEQPRLFDEPTLSLRTVIDSQRLLEQAYTSISAGARTGIAWKPWSRLTVMPSYHVQVSRVDATGAIRPEDVHVVLGCTENPCLQLLSFLEQSATLDQRDNALAPRHGYFTAFGIQEAGGPLGGDYTYLRPLVDLRAFLTPRWLFDGDLTVGARVQLGGLYPTSGRDTDSPVTERFYAGGANSMRGYNTRRLAPLVGIETSPGDPTGPIATVPIGGNGLMVGTVEARYALTSSLALAVFVDTGNVTTGPPSLAELGSLLWDVGVGLRISTPVGPIRLDFARRLPFGQPPPLLVNGLPFAYRQNTSCFGFGGTQDARVETDGACVLHFSIGEAF